MSAWQQHRESRRHVIAQQIAYLRTEKLLRIAAESEDDRERSLMAEEIFDLRSDMSAETSDCPLCAWCFNYGADDE